MNEEKNMAGEADTTASAQPYMVDARVIAKHYASATLLRDQEDWPGVVMLHFSDNDHAEFAFEVLSVALTAGLTSSARTASADATLAPVAAQQAAAVAAPSEHVATVEAGKFANRLQWVSDEAMASVPVGSKLYAAAATTSEDARDAARYRWLRDKARDAAEAAPIVVMMDWRGEIVRDVADDGLRSDGQLDEAMDHAMRATQQEGGK